MDTIAQDMDSHVECIEIGNGDITSIFSSILDQAIEACEKVKSNEYFANTEFNIVALSQGALIGRYLVETCDTKFPVRNFITVGGPNNGLYFEEPCTSPGFRCEV